MSFCGLGGSKKKTGSQFKQRQSTSSNQPQAKIVFGANDFASSQLKDKNSYSHVHLDDKHESKVKGRTSNYADEIEEAEKSHLVQKKQLLNYELDVEDGITKTPMINTFHYDTVLNHNFHHASHLKN